MDFLRHILLFLHLLGMASLLAGFLTQLSARERRMVPAFWHGALTQLVTGIALVPVIKWGLDEDIDGPKILVKLLVALAATAVIAAHRSRTIVSDRVFFGIGGLATLDVAVAVFWT